MGLGSSEIPLTLTPPVLTEELDPSSAMMVLKTVRLARKASFSLAATAPALAKLDAVAFIRAVCAFSAEPAMPNRLSSAMINLLAVLCGFR